MRAKLGFTFLVALTLGADHGSSSTYDAFEFRPPPTPAKKPVPVTVEMELVPISLPPPPFINRGQGGCPQEPYRSLFAPKPPPLVQ